MIEFEHVNLFVTPPTARIEINRPAKKNSMSPAVQRDLLSALDRVEADGGVAALVLTGVGDSFCAGMDLEECFLEPFDDPDEFRRRSDQALRWFGRLKSTPIVTLARVNGWCFGGGVELVGICDLAVAADDAVFGLSEVNFGTIPGGGTLWVLAHHLPRKAALHYALTGARFTGREAVSLGLVNRAVPRDQLDDAVSALLDAIVKMNPRTLRAIKEAFERTAFMTFPESVEWEMAKTFELSYYSGHTWVKDALAQFRRREYRPGLEAYDSTKPRGDEAKEG